MIFTEGSGLNDSVFGKVQNPIKLFLETRGEALEKEAISNVIFNHEKSTHFGEQFGTMTAMEGFKPVGENGAYPDDNMQEGFAKFLQNMTWKDRFVISQEMIEDSVLMDFKKAPQAFLNGYYRTREMYAAAMVGGAIVGNTSVTFRGKTFDATAADDVALFSQSHPSALDSSFVQCNQFSDALSAAAIGKMETAMNLFKGDNGEILDVTPDTIIIPNLYALKNTVFASLGADKDPATSNNGFNYLFGRWNVIVWPYLNQFITSGTSPWIMMDSKYNEAYQTLVWLDRIELTIKSVIDSNTDANSWNGRARFVAGFNDWRGIAVGCVAAGTSL